MIPYHTALNHIDEKYGVFGTAGYEKWPKVQRHEGKCGLAFQHDMADGIPEEMREADVLYAELPWPNGYEKFAEMADVKQRKSYGDLIGDIGREIRELGKPTIVICGKTALKHLNAEEVALGKLNGGNVRAALDETILINRAKVEKGIKRPLTSCSQSV